MAVIRRALRRLWSGGGRPPSSAPPEPTRQGPLASARCLDLRAPSALRYGVVEGALLLTEADALWLPLPEALVVLHDTPVQAEAVAVRLGRTASRAMADWVADGARLRLPDEKAPLVLRQPIRLDESGEEGWVQDIRWGGVEFFYTVELLRGGRLARLADLPEEAITPRNGRGAAGLGEQIGNHRS